MNTSEAKAILLRHSVEAFDDVDRPDTFLGSLRPYRGNLVEKSFHEVMQALQVLAPTLREPTLDREVVSALWHIYFLAERWGIDKDGMLQRNKLISEEDVEKLGGWLGCIGYATMILLGGGSSEEAFSRYKRLGR